MLSLGYGAIGEFSGSSNITLKSGLIGQGTADEIFFESVEFLEPVSVSRDSSSFILLFSAESTLSNVNEAENCFPSFSGDSIVVVLASQSGDLFVEQKSSGEARLLFVLFGISSSQQDRESSESELRSKSALLKKDICYTKFSTILGSIVSSCLAIKKDN